MTIATLLSNVGYIGNGVTTVYPYPFKILDQAHLLVTVNGVTQVLTTNYTVSGAGDAGGGTITFGAAPGNVPISITRVTPPTQLLDLINNDSFPAEALENAIDKLTAFCQEFAELPVNIQAAVSAAAAANADAAAAAASAAAAAASAAAAAAAAVVGATQAEADAGVVPNKYMAPLTARKGVATNSNAAAGQIGEYIESSILVASAISLTTSVAANVTSISLTAGDWAVSGIVRIHSNSATTSFTQGVGSISLTSATLDAVNQANVFSAAAVPTSGVNYCALGIPSARISLASTTTIYLVTRAAFTVSTAQAYGVISARRIR